MFKTLKWCIRKLLTMRSDAVGATTTSNRLGTTAILVWAQGISEIGMEKDFVELMKSDWAPKHQLAGDPQWREAIDSANEFVVAFLKKRSEGVKGKMEETIEL